MRKLALSFLFAIMLSSPAFCLNYSYSNGYQDEGTKMFVKGTTGIQEQNYADALIYLNRAVKLRPDMPEAFHNLGFAYERNGNIKNAIRSYEQAIRLKPDYSSALNNLGYLLAASEQDTSKGVMLCQRAVALQPNNASYRDSLGWALYKSGKNQEAINQFRVALTIDPNYVKSYFNLGLTEYTQANYQSAADCFQNVIRLNSGNIKAYVSLGDCYEKLGDDVKALHYYRQGLTRVPQEDQAKNYLERKVKQLTVDSKQQYFASAKQMHKNGSSRLQDFMNRRSRSGQLTAKYQSKYTQPGGLVAEGNTSYAPVSAFAQNSSPYNSLNSASQAFMSREAIAARDARDTSTIAQSYSTASLRSTAFPRQITVTEERNLERKYSLAKSYMDRGLVNEAASELNSIINIAPQTSIVWKQSRNLLFIVEKQLDKNKSAKAQTHSDMGKDFFRSGQYNLAEDEFNKVLSLDPDNAETHKDMALLYYNQGNYQKAYDFSKKAIALNKTLKESYVVLASLYAKKGRTEDAMRTLRMVPEVSSRRDAVDELAEKMLASLAGTVY